MTPITAAEANRQFSTVLKRVRAGRSYVVTSHGQAVARIVPVQSGDRITNTARGLLFERLRSARVQPVGAWSRNELYEDAG